MTLLNDLNLKEEKKLKWTEIMKNLSEVIKNNEKFIKQSLTMSSKKFKKMENKMRKKLLIEKYKKLEEKIESNIFEFKGKYIIPPNSLFISENDFIFLKDYNSLKKKDITLYKSDVIEKFFICKGLKIIVHKELKEDENFVALL